MHDIDEILSFIRQRGVPHLQPSLPDQLKGSARLKDAIQVLAAKAEKNIDEVGCSITIGLGNSEIAIWRKYYNVLGIHARTSYSTEIFFYERSNELVPVEINENYILIPMTKWLNALGRQVETSDLQECDLEAQHMLAKLADIWAGNLEQVIQKLNDRANAKDR